MSAARIGTEGWVFNIQRFSLDDGPGIRTTVFLKGCSLRCQWCHNPEGQEQRPQIRLTIGLCERCGACVRVCEEGGHEVTAEGHVLHLERCTRCGRCVEACPEGALELVGRRVSVEEVMAVVRRDVPFYEQGGGMTLSGGEPLAQFEFSKALLQAAKAEGIHTAVDTSAFAPWGHLRQLGPLTDLFLVDIKHTDDARHRALTGVSNQSIIANIRRMVKAGWPICLRIPYVPGRNVEHSFRSGLQALLSSLPAVTPVEFLPYHRLGVSKAAALGGIGAMAEHIPTVSSEQIEPWASALRATGVLVKVAR